MILGIGELKWGRSIPFIHDFFTFCHLSKASRVHKYYHDLFKSGFHAAAIMLQILPIAPISLKSMLHQF
jgi:hypothetical protein